MKLAFPAAPPVSLPIRGSNERFPVHRIYCVGRNYNDHVKEMGGVVGRDPPFFFMKPADALVADGRFPYPFKSLDVHHEIECVVALGPGAAIFGHAVGLDMTRRDLQAEAKKLARPWETAKGFDASAPVSEIVPSTEHLARGAISLDVNGSRRQTGDISDMIWSIPEIVAALASYFELRAGDVIFTGTPSGVGPVQRGDRLHGVIAGLGVLDVEVV
ncbi:MAG: fumarylacetoacetate hydrolase family protein [Rhizobiales bacterium]|nr:fumarylacetoacetate hydrolase family protein [Hyphomicrobiales bacterium]MBI3672741.1 fumarylacetoacetate hydrolase family protein [Hyphomicrobiales bacterium]